MTLHMVPSRGHSKILKFIPIRPQEHILTKKLQFCRTRAQKCFFLLMFQRQAPAALAVTSHAAARAHGPLGAVTLPIL